MFGLLFSFCITGAVYDAVWIKNNFNKHWYLGPQYTNSQYNPATPALNGVTNFITCFILYGTLVSVCVPSDLLIRKENVCFILCLCALGSIDPGETNVLRLVRSVYMCSLIYLSRRPSAWAG